MEIDKKTIECYAPLSRRSVLHCKLETRKRLFDEVPIVPVTCPFQIRNVDLHWTCGTKLPNLQLCAACCSSVPDD
ncbi:hypothetical protein CEXT_573531 [Caerostris extrusa]|uniref:Uncharacterized protein n=1 Tax=Caerostris extrusa TaxID=172846 RepID=A0AAV4SC22_CAEEX|nr:hypothetical protein CEXT_573531 [Caerostris extrusa]